jgi:hypothetical protein
MTRITSVVVMLSVSALVVAGCASTPSPTSVSPGPPHNGQVLTCRATRSASGYPFGKQPDRPADLAVVFSDDPAAIRVGEINEWLIGKDGRVGQEITSSLPLFCSPKNWQDRNCVSVKNETTPVTYHLNCTPGESHPNKCEAKLDASTLHVIFVDQGSMASKIFDLNKKTGQLNFGGGGMDGGWSYSGTCKPQ